jgi:hydrogenase nickel incorporation protein HypB
MTVHIPVIEKITKANDRIADRNRALLDANRVVGINMMAAPGAGKTSLIERTLSRLGGKLRVGVVEGDLATSIDAERAQAAGAVAVQINTGTCHLDASMVSQALESLPLAELDLLLVENVGNLICPAGFELGTHHTVLVSSVPEGDDKPFKYPRMYRGADVLVINKIDLLPHVDFDMGRFVRGVEALNERVLTFPVSCRTGEGLDPWADWIRGRVNRVPRGTGS